MTVQHTAPAIPETAWWKSSHSSGGGGECVEVADHADAVHIRDSTRPHGPVLTTSPTAWQTFLDLTAPRHPGG
ncbi:DUF397 domain-containing protein [Streptomyces zingiberis]|uniref:DUF397 domain-containing protein n=1 Tax=Streptomyces zingiberis TaxID=2053010 RepID=A0ABX1BR09_9ACTN|nr:DUF397 domain-containing protein [Streptomyces zingiberis]NJQ00152.1 DUF397 domain-containing protein [Streptomyces zingiberis]